MGKIFPWKSAMFRIQKPENGEAVLTISGRIDAAHIAELDRSTVSNSFAIARDIAHTALGTCEHNSSKRVPVRPTVLPQGLLAMRDRTPGRGDLASPRGVLDILSHNGIEPEWTSERGRASNLQ
jgi:hypothetical protein